jgi:hypothetical protein
MCGDGDGNIQVLYKQEKNHLIEFIGILFFIVIMICGLSPGYDRV